MYIVLQQGSYDSYQEYLERYKTTDEIMEWVKKEAEYCYKEYPTFCIPYTEYKKDVNFVSWEFAHKTITKKHHLCICEQRHSKTA